MARCKHQHIDIIEVGETNVIWQFDGPTLVDTSITDRNLTGAIRVKCCDCSLDRVFGGGAKRPQWVKSYQRRIFDLSTNHAEAGDAR